MSKKRVLCILVCLSSGGGKAPQFSNISSNDLRMVMKDFSGGTEFSTVSPASTLGKWNFEAGMTAGETYTPDIQSLVQNAGGPGDISQLPHGQIFVGVGFAHSIQGEISYFPQTNVAGFTYNQSGLAVKWTFSDEFLPEWPFDWALKASYSQARIAFSQVIQNSSTSNLPIVANIALGDTVFGLDLLVSGFFNFVEPYVGLGFEQSIGALTVTGHTKATVFSPNLTVGQTATSSPGAAHMVVGADFEGLWRLIFGIEYSRAFDVNTYNSKLSVHF